MCYRIGERPRLVNAVLHDPLAHTIARLPAMPSTFGSSIFALGSGPCIVRPFTWLGQEVSAS
eukprot:2325741-Amphidinium_carterae.1